jgi:hypothetical protein
LNVTVILAAALWEDDLNTQDVSDPLKSLYSESSLLTVMHEAPGTAVTRALVWAVKHSCIGASTMVSFVVATHTCPDELPTGIVSDGARYECIDCSVPDSANEIGRGVPVTMLLTTTSQHAFCPSVIVLAVGVTLTTVTVCDTAAYTAVTSQVTGADQLPAESRTRAWYVAVQVPPFVVVMSTDTAVDCDDDEIGVNATPEHCPVVFMRVHSYVYGPPAPDVWLMVIAVYVPLLTLDVNDLD